MPRRAGETLPEPSASLTPEERTALLASAAEITQTTQAKYVEAPNWIEAQPYLRLAGLTGYLSSPDLDERQSGHIRRVIAHQYLDLPQDIPKPKNTNLALAQSVRQRRRQR
ncbi:MAG TPA: hypothetical protein VHD84_01585 [Candidatus Saccharimonadales bacterium]|nr:hypothetical protein [Candidatus Saccharimonadales bacterium]